MPAIADRSKRLVIRLAKWGCTNRPFYHIVLMRNRQPRNAAPIEHIGTYDPFPNENGERLCSVDFKRVQQHLAAGGHFTKPVAQLLGLSGFLPIHPRQVMQARRKRKKLEVEMVKAALEGSKKEEMPEHALAGYTKIHPKEFIQAKKEEIELAKAMEMASIKEKEALENIESEVENLTESDIEQNVEDTELEKLAESQKGDDIAAQKGDNIAAHEQDLSKSEENVDTFKMEDMAKSLEESEKENKSDGESNENMIASEKDKMLNDQSQKNMMASEKDNMLNGQSQENLANNASEESGSSEEKNVENKTEDSENNENKP